MATTLQAPPADSDRGVGRTSPGWSARLQLRYARREGVTRIVERWHRGPLVVQKALYPEDRSTCHSYLVHPPGGVVGGDELQVRIALDPEAHALVTTPSATRLYRSAGAAARIEQRLDVADRAILEWLPQETIVFDASRATLSTRVRLEPAATFVGWEMLALGRPAAAAPFESGHLEQRLEVECAGVPLLRDRLVLPGTSAALHAPWGLAGRRVVGTLVAVGPVPTDAALVGSLRDALGHGSALTGVTRMGGMLVVRVLGDHAHAVTAELVTAWTLIRPSLLGRAAHPPRIWST